MKKILFSLFSIVAVASGCATQGRSVGLGAAVGGGTGMAIGAIADPNADGQYRTRNVIIGGAAGAVAGIVTGSIIHSAVEKQRAEAFEAGKASAQVIDPSQQPKLIPAQWKAEVVDAKRIGNRFIPRHVEYVITDPAKWDEEQ
jgi:hypothetical protein